MRSITAPERAANGAALLDQHEPGWAVRVSLDTLNIESCTACVLGQMFGVYHKGKRDLGLSDEAVVTYGFHPHLFADAARMSDDATELTEAWLDEIRERRFPGCVPAGGAL